VAYRCLLASGTWAAKVAMVPGGGFEPTRILQVLHKLESTHECVTRTAIPVLLVLGALGPCGSRMQVTLHMQCSGVQCSVVELGFW
jgi:hypothetical protein